MSLPKLKLAHMLERKGLSKRQFAKLLGVSYPAVFRYFRDGYDPKLSTLKRWAKVIECKIKDLYDEQ